MGEIRPQPAFLQLGTGDFASPILDIGTGRGDLALYLAGLGHEVLGIDVDAEAIAVARARAQALGSTAHFLVLDVRDVPILSRRFACVVDSGLMHSLDDAERERVAQALCAVVEPTGAVHILGYASRLGRRFGDGWRVEATRDARYFPPQNPEGVPAVLVTLRRRLAAPATNR